MCGEGTVKHPHVLQMALAIVRQHQIYVASESGYGLDSEFAVECQQQEQLERQREHSSVEAEQPELRERSQKRRHEGGRVTRIEGCEATDDAAEKEAGEKNLRELKAALQNRHSVLLTTAFML